MRDFGRGNLLRCGVWLGLITPIKPWLFALALLFVWKRSYRAAVTAASTAALATLLPLLVVGPGELRDYVDSARYFSSATAAVSPQNQALYGFALRLFTTNPFTHPLVDFELVAMLARVAAPLLVLLLLAFSISRSREVSPRRWALEYGCSVAGLLFAAPVVEDIHLTYAILALVPVAAFAWSLGIQNRFAVALAAAAAVSFLYLSLPRLHDAQFAFYRNWPIEGVRLIYTGVIFYGLVAVVCIVFIALMRARSAQLAETDLQVRV
jgi:hypothetical protein